MEVDFLGDFSEESKPGKKAVWWWMLLLVILAAGSLGYGVYAHRQLEGMKGILADRLQEGPQLQQELQRQASLRKPAELTKQKMIALSRLESARQPLSLLYNQVWRSVPAGVELDSIVFTGAGWSIRGTAADYGALGALIIELREQGWEEIVRMDSRLRPDASGIGFEINYSPELNEDKEISDEP